MVKSLALKKQLPNHLDILTELPDDELRWCTVRLQEVIKRSKRLEASVFDIEEKHAREILRRCKWPIHTIGGENAIATDVFVPGRVKRKYLNPNESEAVGFLGSSEMLDVNPVPVKWLSRTEPKYEQFKVKEGYVLVSCSGTIGNVAYVSPTLAGFMISQHAIRIVTDYPGYVYCFLKTQTGKALVSANIYGAVISEIEPEHFNEVQIPNPPKIIKKQIHDKVMRSYSLREESNALLAHAHGLLESSLKMVPLSTLRPRYLGAGGDFRNYMVRLSQLNARLDASYHLPIVHSIMSRLTGAAGELTTIGDPRISSRVILPGRFARVYVKEGQGTVFFGGKQLYQLDPANKKYLSLAKHGKRIKRDLTLKENMILITRSGTIGKVASVPIHWAKWIVNEHIIRVEPATPEISGFLYVFLTTDYGRELITRFTYGSVVDEIDDHHVSQIPVPLLKDLSVQKQINRLALEANAKRAEAYYIEQEAIELTNSTVIHASKDGKTTYPIKS